VSVQALGSGIGRVPYVSNQVECTSKRWYEIIGFGFLSRTARRFSSIPGGPGRKSPDSRWDKAMTARILDCNSHLANMFTKWVNLLFNSTEIKGE
jgi:hypothetical protein